jgi:S-adenosylmethionine:tRNA ribosyltransferase-isomerase
MNVSDFDYELPEDLIAQEPLQARDASRLMVLDRASGTIAHHHFRDIVELIDPGDVLVLNTTRVIPARLQAIKAETKGAVEILLLRQLDDRCWHVMAGGKRVNTGLRLEFPGNTVTATIIDDLEGPERILQFDQSINSQLADLGEVPLPPYIHTHLEDGERYQTIYGQVEGSAAAPTAGLHFTGDTLLQLRNKGVQLAYCTLHIGLNTFQPVRVGKVEDHPIHSEYAILTAENASIINNAKLAGQRIIAVGTTSARTLESAAITSAGGDPSCPTDTIDLCPWRPVIAFEQETGLFIYPGYQWRVVDALVTNFHLPRSTLLMMVSAFAERETILKAYENARQNHYRFYSFGDAMFIR